MQEASLLYTWSFITSRLLYHLGVQLNCDILKIELKICGKQTCQVQENFFGGNELGLEAPWEVTVVSPEGEFSKFKPLDPGKMEFQHSRSWSQTQPNIMNFCHKHTHEIAPPQGSVFDHLLAINFIPRIFFDIDV